MADGPLFFAGTNQADQFSSMVSSGVESLRVVFSWSASQPFKSFSDVPASELNSFTNVNGVPTSFTGIDQIVAVAASHRISVLPVVEYTPPWDAKNPVRTGSAPRSARPYAAFLRALVHRYGPNGTFWATNPGLPRSPVRMWQIWNEPNFSAYWSDQPHWEASYVKLLRAAHGAIKSSDRTAKVVLAGFPNFSWKYLQGIYRIRGARGLFDMVAAHPYTSTAGNVIKILQLVRAVMRNAGDGRKPLLADEVGWPAARGQTQLQYSFDTTEAGQAHRLGKLIPLLARDRVSLGLAGFYYYTWISDESPPTNYPFDFSGLLKYRLGTISPTPSLGVFTRSALRIEGCRSKTLFATQCA